MTIIIIIRFHDVFLRYPFHKTFTARRIINAPIEAVWEQLRPRGRNKNYSALHTSIRKIGDDVFRYYEANPGQSEKTFIDVKLIHEIPHQVLEMEYVDDDSPHDGVKTSRGFIYAVRPISEDQTEVFLSDVHHKPSFFTFYVFEFLGAHRDDLRQLACACEGQENISWASAQIAMDELAARPDATLRDTLRPLADGTLIAVTALTTILVIFAIWVV